MQSFFESIKGYSKKVSEVKECYATAVATAAALHRDRRVFLRSALRELALLCADQPGLLGPKALFIFMGLCFSRDEVVWMVQHHENPPSVRQASPFDSVDLEVGLRLLFFNDLYDLFVSQGGSSKQKVQEDLVDRYLPELLFYMEEIRALVRKYAQVVQRYYVQYLSGYDAVALSQSMQVGRPNAIPPLHFLLRL